MESEISESVVDDGASLILVSEGGRQRDVEQEFCIARHLVRCRLVAIHVPKSNRCQGQCRSKVMKIRRVGHGGIAYIFRVAEGRVATIPSTSLVSLT